MTAMDTSFWSIAEPGEFTSHLVEYLADRRTTNQQTELGSVLLDVLELHTVMMMEGFCDIFFHMLTLERCRSVSALLRQMDLLTLAALFDEAFLIYCRGRTDLTSTEFAALEPFSLDGEAGRRFDQIGELFDAPDSEIYTKLCFATRAFAVEHRAELE
ncbi:MAG: hypothetical protein ABI134_22425 [Byssovorax sp.]